MKGSEAWKSTTIISASSTSPRKCAATKPTMVPNTAPISVPASATDSDIRRPAIKPRHHVAADAVGAKRILARARPGRPGGLSRLNRSCSVVPNGVKTLPITATATISASTAAAAVTISEGRVLIARPP